MKLSAPAKINLALDIVGRRTDGYHELDMVMQSISLADTVSLERTETDCVQVLCDAADVPCGPENTIARAADAFFRMTAIRRNSGLLFRIDKRIPSRAGLGGGSADAAASLRLLNAMYCAGLSAAELAEIGLTVGADVPFCLAGGTARVRGIGERVEPAAALAECAIAVCRPDAGFGTREAYAAYDRAQGSSTKRHTASVLHALENGSLAELGASLGNAFEDAGVPPVIAELEAAMMRQGAAGSCMTGSGSAVFGLFKNESGAKRCCGALRQQQALVFLCHPVSGYFPA